MISEWLIFSSFIWENMFLFRSFGGELRIVLNCVLCFYGISARLKIAKDWWGLMRFACLRPQGSGCLLTSRQLNDLSQQPWRSLRSSIENHKVILEGRCPVSTKYSKELIKWFWFYDVLWWELAGWWNPEPYLSHLNDSYRSFWFLEFNGMFICCETWMRIENINLISFSHSLPSLSTWNKSRNARKCIYVRGNKTKRSPIH